MTNQITDNRYRDIFNRFSLLKEEVKRAIVAHGLDNPETKCLLDKATNCYLELMELKSNTSRGWTGATIEAKGEVMNIKQTI